MHKIIFNVFIVLFALSACNKKENNTPSDDWPTDSIRVIHSTLNYPWEILWGKDDFIWMTERGGKISKVDPKTGNIVFTKTIADVVAVGEGGLLGMVQHPDFLSNGFLYVVYNYTGTGGYKEKVVQLKYLNNQLDTVATLIKNLPASGIHNGSRLLITNEGSPKLFITTGDANVANDAQQKNSLAGKVLRINLDGSIPSDNPIAGSPIWTIGHRNPQGLVLANGLLYTSEHGPSVEDELNVIEKNRNYGWPTVTGPCDEPVEIVFCNINNVKPPIWSSGNVTFATCGLDYYNNSRISAWQNSLLLVSLKDANLRVLTLGGNGQSITKEQVYFKNRFGRIRDICVSPAGRVYMCTGNGGNVDQLIEISAPK